MTDSQEIPGRVMPESRTVVYKSREGHVVVESVVDLIYRTASAEGEQLDVAQRLSELADARNERVADGSVSEYGDGATELTTQQAQLAAEELTAPHLGSQMRQEGAE